MLKDKKVMNFIVTFKKRIADFGAESAFNRLLPFDEIETLKAATGYFKKSMGFREIHVFSIEDDQEKYAAMGVDEKVLETAEPGQPSFTFENVEA